MLNVKFIREAWIPKLRSGDIKQGNCYLYKQNTTTKEVEMCCMGVAYEITPNKKWEKWTCCWDDIQTYTPSNGISSGYLDDTTKRFIGLEEHHEKRLAALNDKERKTFDEIADELELWCVEQEALHSTVE